MDTKGLTMHTDNGQIEVKYDESEGLQIDTYRVALENECIRLKEKLCESNKRNETLSQTVELQYVEITNLITSINGFQEEIQSIAATVNTITEENQRELEEYKKSVLGELMPLMLKIRDHMKHNIESQFDDKRLSPMIRNSEPEQTLCAEILTDIDTLVEVTQQSLE